MSTKKKSKDLKDPHAALRGLGGKTGSISKPSDLSALDALKPAAKADAKPDPEAEKKKKAEALRAKLAGHPMGKLAIGTASALRKALAKRK